jgi:hypothetical protein
VSIVAGEMRSDACKSVRGCGVREGRGQPHLEVDEVGDDGDRLGAAVRGRHDGPRPPAAVDALPYPPLGCRRLGCRRAIAAAIPAAVAAAVAAAAAVAVAAAITIPAAVAVPAAVAIPAAVASAVVLAPIVEGPTVRLPVVAAFVAAFVAALVASGLVAALIATGFITALVATALILARAAAVDAAFDLCRQHRLGLWNGSRSPPKKRCACARTLRSMEAITWPSGRFTPSVSISLLTCERAASGRQPRPHTLCGAPNAPC